MTRRVRLSLHELEGGVTTSPGNRVVYDVARGEAHFGAASVAGQALVWDLGVDTPALGGELLSRTVDLGSGADWLMRCDRVDFPPGGIAYLHTHPGPGIRYLLHGGIEIATEGQTTSFAPGEAWFEAGPEPVRATASVEEETSFVRVLVLPAEWEGKRTIRYVDPADDERPKLQRATVFLDRRVAVT
jgi:hypothetical protein